MHQFITDIQKILSSYPNTNQQSNIHKTIYNALEAFTRPEYHSAKAEEGDLVWSCVIIKQIGDFFAYIDPIPPQFQLALVVGKYNDLVQYFEFMNGFKQAFVRQNPSLNLDASNILEQLQQAYQLDRKYLHEIKPNTIGEAEAAAAPASAASVAVMNDPTVADLSSITDNMSLTTATSPRLFHTVPEEITAYQRAFVEYYMQIMLHYKQVVVLP